MFASTNCSKRISSVSDACACKGGMQIDARISAMILTDGAGETMRSDALSPVGIVASFQWNRDRSIRIERLFTRPCNRSKHAGTKLQFRGKSDVTFVVRRQEKRREANPAANRMTGIEC